MNPKRLCLEAGIALRNLVSPAPKAAVSQMHAIWQDTGGSCILRRPERWLEPENGVDISIIIPCYNNAPFLRRSLDSVLEQKTRFSFEAVVIDDGSTDETPEILAQYGERITLITQENRGHSGARNAGLARCRGRYLLFHDSDDTLLPGSLEALMTCAENNQADIALGGYLCHYADGTETPGLSFPDGIVTDPETVPGMTCGKLIRRQLFAMLQFPEGYWYEDSVISQILLPMAKGVYSVSTPIFSYYINPSGVSAASQGQPKALESLYVTQRLLEERSHFGLKADIGAYTHFLHMVLLTYHRTRRLGHSVPYGVFLSQQQLQHRYFSRLSIDCVPASFRPLAQALEGNRFRRYLWLCETLWLTRNMGGRT